MVAPINHYASYHSRRHHQFRRITVYAVLVVAVTSFMIMIHYVPIPLRVTRKTQSNADSHDVHVSSLIRDYEVQVRIICKDEIVVLPIIAVQLDDSFAANLWNVLMIVWY